ncbi:hypothetical protein [Haloferula sp. A504]|uniref:hypothetical protein n=1 Tax=Haloferula sp. A504 TaxID=3373601 RepID=UPI0031BD3F6F|nr:hypothetical protein [Verrucomicrobiaceae bacterium E54]
MSTTSESPATKRWPKVASLARIARQLLPLWQARNVRSPHLIPLLEAAITVTEARAEIGDGELPDYDPELPVQLIDENELEALGRCVDAIYQAGKNLMADAFCFAEAEDDFSREAVAYATVSEAVWKAFRAAFGEADQS